MEHYDCAVTSSTKKSWGVFGATLLVATLLLGLWSQLTPLGSAPDEASHFIKSAAVIRGQPKGEELPGWVLSMDGWVYDSGPGISHILIVSNDEVLQRTPLNTLRDDVTSSLNIPATTVVGFSIWQMEFALREPYFIYAERNDGSIVPLQILDGKNVLSSPTDGVVVNGVAPTESSTTRSLVEDSHFNGRMELSHWSTYVDIDPQFDGANAVQRCFVAQPTQPGCGLRVQDQVTTGERPITAMGRYTPAVYLVPGLGTVNGANNTAWFAARLWSALAAAIIIALATTTLSRRLLSSIPLVAALTPAVIFLSSVVNPSGLEVMSAIALWIALPGLLTADRRDSWEITCFATSGVALILARPLGMVYYTVVIVVCVLANGSTKSIITLMRRHRWVVGLHAAILTFATWWYLFVYNTNVDDSRAAYLAPDIPLGEQLIHALSDTHRVLLEAVGDLGSLEVPAPRLVFMLFVIVTTSLIALSWRNLKPSTKLASITLITVMILFVVATDINYYRIIRSYGVQGRHITPLLVGLPLLAARNLRLSLTSRVTIVVLWAVAQFFSGYAALRRYSVGIIGDNFFAMFSNPAWQPSFGITGTLVLLALLLAVSAFGILKLEPHSS